MNGFKKILSVLSDILSTGFGVGFSPIASGTVASAVMAILWFLIPEYYFYNPIDNEIFFDRYFIMLVGLILASFIGFYICTQTEKKLGKDAKQIVFDEFIGYLFAVIFLPKTMMVAIYAFVLFRVFDIAKPLGINKLQDLPAGYGIMCDDILAGIYSNILLQILYRVKPEFFTFI